MSLLLPTPTQLRLVGYENQRSELEERLAYVDEKIDYELRKFKSNPYFLQRYGQAAYQQRLEELKAARNKSLLFEDSSGLWTYSGLAHSIADAYGDPAQVQFQYPSSKTIPWAKTLDRTPRYYQLAAVEKLLEEKHACVEISTGLGKSLCVLLLCKALALKSVIMAPSVSIAGQLLDEFTTYFGKRYVGQFFDGKKEFNKLFTIAVAQSLTKIEKDTPAWDVLSKSEVFIADESHMCPAKTLSEVCFGLVADAPYRFFFSGTQLRNDGLGILLDAITGKTVYRMSVEEGVDQGFLAKPMVRMIRMDSKVNFSSGDANEMTRNHVFYNPDVNAAAADIINRSVSLLKRNTLVLVDELEQFGHLAPLLRFEARYAHGGGSKASLEKVPEAHRKSDPKKLVEAFDRGEFPILVGTSCIATGTDIKSCKSIVYLRGGKSEIEVRQGAIGRGTRIVPGKSDFYVFDFGIDNVPMLNKHALARKKIYQAVYPGGYQEIKLNAQS